MYVRATPLARGRAGGASRACALACARGASDGGGARLRGAPARPIRHTLEGMEVALWQNLSGRLTQTHRRGCKHEYDGVDEDADQKDDYAGHDADGRAVNEFVDILGRAGMHV